MNIDIHEEFSHERMVSVCAAIRLRTGKHVTIGGITFHECSVEEQKAYWEEFLRWACHMLGEPI